MKKLIFCVLITAAAFMLGACGGGGGGGGGATADAIPSVESSIFSVSPANKTGSTIEQDGDRNDPNDDYVLIKRDANGLVFVYRDVANKNLLGNSDEYSLRQFKVSTGAGSKDSDFKVVGDYQRAEAVSRTQRLDHTVRGQAIKGDFTSTNIVETGGKQLGLKYADFGMWKSKAEFDGSINGNPTHQILMSEPEILTDEMGNSAREAYFAANGNGRAVFRGNAMGVVRAHAGGEDVAAPLSAEIYGSAVLDVNLADRNANLDLKFKDFYNFSITKLSVRDREGELDKQAGSAISYTPGANGNNTGVGFANGSNPRFEVDGQFYGPSRTNPTEVVGDVEIRGTSNDPTNSRLEVDIAFGAKK